MAGTEVKQQGIDVLIAQTSWWGFKKKEVLILRKSEATGRISLRPRSHGIHLNREEINLWGGPVILSEGDIVRLPWGWGKHFFPVDENVLLGGIPKVEG